MSGIKIVHAEAQTLTRTGIHALLTQFDETIDIIGVDSREFSSRNNSQDKT